MYIPEHELIAALRPSYPLPEWCFVAKVPDQAGFNGVRTCDALALNTYPGRGLELHGFELKASRGDTLKELRDPEKSESIIRYCDRWWLVVTSADFVKDGELPQTWGLKVASRKTPDGPITFATKVKAPKLKRVKPDWSFTAAMMRKAMEQNGLDERERAAVRSAGFNEGKAEGKRDGERERASLEREIEGFKSSIEHFEQASGLVLSHGWQNGRIGEAIKLLMSGMAQEKFDKVLAMAGTAEAIASSVRTHVEQLQLVAAEQAAKDRALAEGKDINHYLPDARFDPSGWSRRWA